MGEDLTARLRAARLYLVCGAISDAALGAAIRGGVDLVQLRLKDAGDADVVDAARRMRHVCTAAGVPLLVNDRPDLALDAGADGVHVGQGDVSVSDARAIVGPDRLVGLSTHDAGQIAAAQDSGADYIGVGPVFATPTKPGRAAVGVELVAEAAARSALPWFAIGGIDAHNIQEVVAAGAHRIAVVRAIVDSSEPEAAARQLSSVLATSRTGSADAA